MYNNFTSSPHLGHRRRRRGRVIKILLIIFLLASLFFFIDQFLRHKSDFSTINKDIWVARSLKEAVEKSLEGIKGTYGIAIKNLKTGESYFANEHRIYQAGSLYKLWVMATAFQQIREGKLSEDDILSEDASILNDKFNIASETAELSEGTVTLTVRDALNQMITISHNYAALLLTEKVRLSSVSNFLTDNGFNESEVGTNGESPTVTASDMAYFYEKLYEGKLGTEENTQKMIGVLKRQQLNDKLPKYLPKDAEVAHKTGEIDYLTHDAGIVFSKKGDYIIVALSDSSSPTGAAERIAGLSKTVFDYFAR